MASLSASNHVARVLSVADQVADVDNGSRIANSWRRCLIDHKLDPGRRGPPQTLTEAELRHVAEPMEEPDPARDARAGRSLPRPARRRLLRQPGRSQRDHAVQPASAARTDDRIFLQWKVYTGSNFSEAFEGTNGLGTALAEQKPILVHRDEHFREQWGIFTCAVAPLFDHAGGLAGAVNITSCRDDLDRAAHQLALAVTMEADAADRALDLPPPFSQRLDRDGAGRSGGSGLIAYDDDRRHRRRLPRRRARCCH